MLLVFFVNPQSTKDLLDGISLVGVDVFNGVHLLSLHVSLVINILSPILQDPY